MGSECDRATESGGSQVSGFRSTDRYRWETAERQCDLPCLRRINWSGAALAAFYAAVRQALVVAIIIRAIATAMALGGIGWWMYQHWYKATAL